ncbi:MAG: AbrB/MazE/SpoVT family DNA-binding domain-containing protein [Clostridia bacterium]|nr:AbrB/MazE/SpoVT family DNA-binding domain-containing protein [Clostridia bacterium]
MKEKRSLNVSFGKTGKGYVTPKLSLPKSDLEDMGITSENREINYYYDKENKQIILSK